MIFQGLRGHCAALLAAAIVSAAPSLVGAASQREPRHLPVTIDAFEDPGAWIPLPADGVSLSTASDTGMHGQALRLDFDFRLGSGWAVIHRDVDVDLPDNYAFSFRIRGNAPSNHLEFKLIDETGANVWWSVRRDVTFSDTWQFIRIKKRHISFAWGPAGGGEIRKVRAIEFAITAGSGGNGSIWIDDLQLSTLPPADTPLAEPVPSASSESAPDADAGRILDGNPATAWSPLPGDEAPWVSLDLQGMREYGGLILDWAGSRGARDYTVLISDDGMIWRDAARVRGSNGGRDYIYLPEGEARHIRIDILDPTSGFGLAEVAVQPLSFSTTRESFVEAIAKDAPRGTYPRSFCGEQTYWTVVGADADPRECLLGEDGAIEAGMRSFSIEPFLYDRGRLVTWNDVKTGHALQDGFLPIPTVTWTAGDLELAITATSVGEPSASSVLARYRITNHGSERRRGQLFLAIRPFQVNPPTQFLNNPGGTARIDSIAFRDRGVEVNGAPRIWFEIRPMRAGAVTFDQGDIVADYLAHGEMPEARAAVDPSGGASGAMAYPFDLDPGYAAAVDVVIPLHGTYRGIPEDDAVVAAARWRSACAGPEIVLPRSASRLIDVMKSQVGFILVNRSGPSIQPGTRSYARSWIRDGSLTSSALLRLGHAGPVREFIEWFAPHQFPNGKIPCVVDHRGPDPVPEHDSSGEFIFLIAEYHRYTKDGNLVARMWPRVAHAAAYLDSLRAQRRTEEYRSPDKSVFFGLLPQSISHEGYSAEPMHSYWDDFFALRGFKDAVYLARVLGRADEAKRLDAIRREFEGDLSASIRAAMRRHAIDYVPGCADLGDFDATSTTIALSPAGADGVPPAGAIERTFDRYFDFFARRRADATWDVYTPYETRAIGSFVRLGQREKAHALIDFFFEGVRPPGWNQWAEVVGREERAPRFIGDMPHTWVGSDFVRSVLDCFAYVREGDSTLVIAAGVLPSWAGEDSGVVVRNLPTPHGTISYSIRDEKPANPGERAKPESETRDRGATHVRIEGELTLPPGGMLLDLPEAWRKRGIRVDGRPAAVEKTGVRIRQIPASVVLMP